jgi:hydrogenase maturation protease
VHDAPRRLVLGLGNPDRGDDGAGRLVARLLRGHVPDDVRVEEAVGDAAGVIDALQGADWVVLVDAAVSGAPPGTIHRIDCAAGETLPARGGTSSHGLGVAEAVALARALGGLPRCCVVYAIEGLCFEPGSDVTPPVCGAARKVAGKIAADLEPEGAGISTLRP